jgi:hypothetical protein
MIATNAFSVLDDDIQETIDTVVPVDTVNSVKESKDNIISDLKTNKDTRPELQVMLQDSLQNVNKEVVQKKKFNIETKESELQVMLQVPMKKKFNMANRESEDRTQVPMKKKFNIVTRESEDWSEVTTKKKFNKFQNDSYSQKEYENKHTRDGINAENSEYKKKTFTNVPVIPKKENLILPEYYSKRTIGNIYEIPQFEADWIKRIGAVLKSTTVEQMQKSLIQSAIVYFDNYKNSNKYFIDKINKDDKQEELLEEIIIQTVSIFVHLLIKQDTIITIKDIIENFPSYRNIIGQHITNSQQEKRTNGENIYMSLISKWIEQRKILHISKKQPEKYTKTDIDNAKRFITMKENKWTNYVIQSVWNGNNPIHDCLYYGSCRTLEYILSYCMKSNMYIQLNTMMSVPNIQNETHIDIINNGMNSCKNKLEKLGRKGAFTLRMEDFSKCKRFYNNTVDALRKHVTTLINHEADDILNNTINTNINSSLSIDDSDVSNYGDTTNIVELLQSNDMQGMISHIVKCGNLKNANEVITSTFNFWEDIAKSNDKLKLLLDDVKAHELVVNVLMHI